MSIFFLINNKVMNILQKKTFLLCQIKKYKHKNKHQ